MHYRSFKGKGKGKKNGKDGRLPSFNGHMFSVRFVEKTYCSFVLMKNIFRKTIFILKFYSLVTLIT